MELHHTKNIRGLRFQGGERVGCLTIIGHVGTKHFARGVAVVFECKCVCGNTIQRDRQTLIKSAPSYCGSTCKLAFGTSAPGSSKHPLHKRWAHMLDRCYNERNKSFPDYGSRGIGVCERWRYGDGQVPGFQCFIADMGECPEGLTLERQNGSGNYEPSNCIWASRKIQSRNRRSLRMVEWEGVSRSVGEWAEITGIPYFTLMRRVKLGWSAERALTEPLRKY